MSQRALSGDQTHRGVGPTHLGRLTFLAAAVKDKDITVNTRYCISNAFLTNVSSCFLAASSPITR